MPQVDHLAEIRAALSATRLRLAFRAVSGEPESTTLARSLHNLALCEALYPVLQHLEAGKAVTPHRLIAGLSLGFWANLFTRAYEIAPDSSYVVGASKKTALWPRHLRAVLPHLPRRFATRDHAYRSFRTLADLRNQVFHHRPIWRMQLNAIHVLATEAIGWISPDLKELTMALDRFPQVVTSGIKPYEDQVADFLASRTE